MRRRCAAALIVLGTAGVFGCGSEDYPNEPRPAAPVELSAKIDDEKVVFVPDQTGAGIAVITISNQSSDDVELALSGPTDNATNEIVAGGVGTLRLELAEGDYSVEPSVASISSASLTVGPPRASAQNDLLLP